MLSELNRLSEAQDEYEAILRDKPDHTAALVGLGVIWRKRGKYEKAVDTYHQALKADPNLKLAHFNMALIYDFYLNDRVKAQFHYDRFLELGGDPNKLPEDRRPPGTPKVARSCPRKMSAAARSDWIPGQAEIKRAGRRCLPARWTF